MAYRNFSELAEVDLSFGDLIVGTRAAAAPDTPAFTDLEWSVVEIARRDPLSSIEAPGRFAGKLASLLGTPRSLPLADPRLEALRRFVVADHHLRDRLPDSQVAQFISAGFTRDHVRLLRSSPLLR
ncbi:MAG: hypothetical protein DI568_08075 [Sphingomonas sp.]|nr:MAG: hypothetical protein DI568_08075 [Sphingomonas sp.]